MDKKERKGGRIFKTIYESKKPKFKISVDSFQWILDGIGPTCYFPKLSMLLDELAEKQFKNSPTKIKELRRLDGRITEVYMLIDRVGKGVKEKWH